MKVLFPTGQTRPFYDRNARYDIEYFTIAATAPHVGTIRSTLTIPTGYRMLISQVYFLSQVYTAPTTRYNASVFLSAEIPGKISRPLVHFITLSTVVNYITIENLPVQIWLPAETILRITSVDSSTGGTIGFNFMYNYILFSE